MRNNSKIDIVSLASDLLWRNVVSHKDEGSCYFIVTTDAYEPLYKKDMVYKGLNAMSNIHPDSYRELTWGEFYKWNGLYVDDCCATCKHWDKENPINKDNQIGKDMCKCLKKNVNMYFFEGKNCENYERRG